MDLFSVSIPTFLGPSRLYRTRIENHTLGKRKTNYRHSPVLGDEWEAKRSCPGPWRYSNANLRQEFDSRTTWNDTHLESTIFPWHGNDTYLSSFDEPESRAIIEPKEFLSERFAFGNDDCPIHPIFAFLAKLGTNIPLFVPALRLATRYLFSKHALIFFHTICTTPLTLLQNETLFYDALIHHLDRSPYHKTGLPDAERQLTIQKLLALADHVSIQISPDPRLERTWAYTERFIPPQYPEDCRSRYRHLDLHPTLLSVSPMPCNLQRVYHQEFSLLTARQIHITQLSFSGTNARINLSPTFLRALHPDTFPQPSYAAKLRAMYFMAITLIHELAHAVWICRVAPPAPNLSNQSIAEYEPFHHSDRKAELGYALESRIFHGYHIMPLGQHIPFNNQAERPPDFTLGLAWLKWPDISEFFVTTPYTLGPVPLARLHSTNNTVSDIRRWKVVTGSKFGVLYVISHEWIYKQFFRETWDQLEQVDVSSDSSRALHVEKKLGLCRRNVDFGMVSNGEPDWDVEARRKTRAMAANITQNETGVGGANEQQSALSGTDTGDGLGGDDEGSVSETNSIDLNADQHGVLRPGQPYLESDDEDEDEEEADDEDEDI